MKMVKTIFRRELRPQNPYLSFSSLMPFLVDLFFVPLSILAKNCCNEALLLFIDKELFQQYKKVSIW